MDSEKPNPFDEGKKEEELIEEAYQSVRTTKFDLSLLPEMIVKGLHRDMAKRLYYNEPTNSSDYIKETLPFLVFSSAVIEEKSKELLLQNLIKSHHKDHPKIVSEIDDWSQGKKEDTLFQLQIIEQELKDKMTAVRKTRNNLVHEPEKHNSIEEAEYGSNTLPVIIEKALECVEELSDKTTEFDLST